MSLQHLKYSEQELNSIHELKNKKERIDYDSEENQDKFFEKSRKFYKKERQPRNNGDFFQSSFISKLFFFDLIKSLFQGSSRVKNLQFMDIKDVPNLGQNDDGLRDSNILLDKLQQLNKPIQDLKPLTIWRVILGIQQFPFIIAITCCILCTIGKMVSGIFINLLIDDLQSFIVNNKNGEEKDSQQQDNLQNNIYLYLIIVCVTVLIYDFGYHLTNRYCYELTLKIRSMFLQMIYSKITIMSQFQIKDANIGQLINLASNDFNQIEYKVYPIIQFYISWFAIIASAIILVQRFGWVGLVSMAVLMAGIFLQTLIAKFYGKYAMKRAEFNDQRIKLCSEVIEGIRLIKMYTWEGKFVDMIQEIRKKELMQSFYLLFLYYVSNGLNNVVVFFALILQIVVMNAIDDIDNLTTGKLISTLDLLQFMRFQLLLTTFGMTGHNEFMNIMERSKTIMGIQSRTTQNLEQNIENGSQNQQNYDNNSDIIIDFKNFSAFWEIFDKDTKKESDLKPVLKNINLQIKKNELISIVGKIGSGKSSLLNCFLNEIPTIKGQFSCKGSIAYVEQEPYIFNGTVRDNIVLGKPYIYNKYKEIVEVCCLLPDFEELQDKDQTEIGERGINLSGGQKARISMARAIYQDADIYLLDDPLSAVDSKVGKLLFNNAIKDYLQNKCVILVTHQLHFCSKTDKIVVLKEGEIFKQGKFELMKEVLQNLKGQIETVNQINEDILVKQNNVTQENNIQKIPVEVKDIKIQSLTQSVKESENQQDNINQQLIKTFEESDKKLIQDEEDEIIEVSFKSYCKYIKNSGQSLSVFIAVLQYVLDMYLYLRINSEFTEYVQVNTKEKKEILIRCTYLTFVFFFTQCIKYVNLSQIHMQSVKEYQRKLISSLFRTKTIFFDQTPTGNILNRFSNDTGLTDLPLFFYIVDCLEIIGLVVGILIYIGYLNPWLFIGMFIELSFLVILYKSFNKLLKFARIMDIRYRSPVYTFFSVTLGGIVPLKIYKQIDNFRSVFSSLADNSQRASYYFWFLSTGYGFIAQIISTIIGLGIVITLLFITLNDEEGDKKATDVGLVIVYILVFQNIIQWLVRQLISLDIGMSSLERINNYTYNVPHERPYIFNEEKKEKKEILSENQSDQLGQIEFKNVSLKYRSDLDLVLKNVSFKIESNQKVACVGRTGAGKSSLLQALFRMVEIEDFDNNKNGIFINNQRIQDKGLKILRNSMGIIPQNPFIFSGTVKRNLDPLNEYSEEQIIGVLKQIDLFDEVSKLEKGIHTDMSNVQSVFSIGQKQLICLGRIILKNTKIVVLDEATANVDMKTDDFIQKTIKEQFKNSTIFTIAHRLNTIADYDKVLVMDQGQVAEFDIPFKLLARNDTDTYITRDDTILSQMVNNTGKQNSQKIFDISKLKYQNFMQNQNQ